MLAVATLAVASLASFRLNQSSLSLGGGEAQRTSVAACMLLVCVDAARMLRPRCSHARRLSSGTVDAAMAAARQLGAADRAQLLDGLVADLRDELLVGAQSRPSEEVLTLATRLADHGDLLRAMLNCTVTPAGPAAADRRRTLFASKTAVQLLPKRSFSGRVVVARNEAEICAALGPLQGVSVVGFDTETRPEFRAGKGQNPTCLIQLAHEDYACLLQIRAEGQWTCREGWRRERWLPDPLIDLLQDESIVKAGIGVGEDLNSLNKQHRGLRAKGACDLDVLAKRCIQSPVTTNLQAMVAIYLHFQQEKTKRIQCSNWEAASLTERQIEYAATDAWVGFLLYEKLQTLIPKSKGTSANAKSASPTPKSTAGQSAASDEGKSTLINGKCCLAGLLQRLPFPHCLLRSSAVLGIIHYRCSNPDCTTAPVQLLAGSPEINANDGDRWLPEHTFSTNQKSKPASSIRCIPCVQRSQ